MFLILCSFLITINVLCCRSITQHENNYREKRGASNELSVSDVKYQLWKEYIITILFSIEVSMFYCRIKNYPPEDLNILNSTHYQRCDVNSNKVLANDSDSYNWTVDATNNISILSYSGTTKKQLFITGKIRYIHNTIVLMYFIYINGIRKLYCKNIYNWTRCCALALLRDRR